MKINPNPNPNPNDNHCSSIFLLPVIKWFFSFEKYNTKNTTRIKHVYKIRWYNTYTTLKYNTTFIQHVIQHVDTALKCHEDAHIKRNLFCFQFKNLERIFKKRQFHPTRKIQHAYNAFIQHAYNKKIYNTKNTT